MQGLHTLHLGVSCFLACLYPESEMTSDYYKLIPKDPEGNLLWRKAVAKRANEDPEFAAAMRQACKEDILFWINGFIWTYDPRRKPFAKLPMITYDFQDKAILKLVDAISKGRDLLLEKSRDMGASWICLLVFLWFWMFRPLQSFLVGSRVENYVDQKGNPKSLFWKLDFALDCLPWWMRPKIERTKMHLFNVETCSVIDGESTTIDFSRGDRRTAILLDEFAAVEFGQGVLFATRDATNCRIVNSTHQGTGTAYYSLSRTNIDKLRLHWAEHNLKAIGLYTRYDGEYHLLDRDYWLKFDRDVAEDMCREMDAVILERGVPLEDGKLRSVWYALQCQRAAHAVEIAQELDIDSLGSSHQFFDAQKMEDYIRAHACRPYRIGNLIYDRDTLEPIRWEDDPRGKIKLWLQLDGNGRPVNREVVLGADISAGTGASNSALSGINKRTFEKVLEFADPRIRPEEFGRFSVAVCRWFDNAFLIWEQNGPGRQYGEAVIESGYRHVYFRKENAERIGAADSLVPGWAPTKDGKVTLLGDYRRAIDLQTVVNHSEDALRDALEYVYMPNNSVEHSRANNSIDPSGARANHGDRTIADALAWKGVRDRPVPKSRATSTQKAPANTFLSRRQKYLANQRPKNAWSTR
jgi:hypothetical protein